MTTASARSLTVTSGVLLFVSLDTLKGVDGLASKSTYYNDNACEVAYGSSSLIFGFPDLDSSSVLRECGEVFARNLSLR